MSEETRKPIGVEAQCWGCSQVWNISLLPSDAKDISCPTCGGYVVTPSGKVMIRPFYDQYDSTAPLLEPNAKPRIILPGEE